jgi:DnaJ family protein C protein 28
MDESSKKRPGQSWDNYIEEQIRDAMERGEFDNLKGKGKPQTFGEHHGDPSLEMAHKLMRDAGFVPTWLELEREIERKQKEAEESVLRSWRWREAVRGDHIEDPRWIEAEWRKARELFEKRIAAINGKIMSFNLQLPQPLLHRQRPRLRLDSEFAQLGIENG